MRAAALNTPARTSKALLQALALCALMGLLLGLCACGGQGAGTGSASSAAAGQDEASGAPFSPASAIADAVFSADAAQGGNGALLDTSHADEG